MQLASATSDIEKRVATHEPKSLADFKRSVGRNVPTAGFVRSDYQQPIDEVIARVNLNLLNRGPDELKRAEERRAQTNLALQLIDIGYKALASKLHPDKAAHARPWRGSMLSAVTLKPVHRGSVLAMGPELDRATAFCRIAALSRRRARLRNKPQRQLKRAFKAREANSHRHAWRHT
jgi:hypothetical protein